MKHDETEKQGNMMKKTMKNNENRKTTMKNDEKTGKNNEK